MTRLLSRRPWRNVSPVTMYWRRRRRMTAVTAAPLRIVERRISPVTRLSVHQHLHHVSHARLVLSPVYSTVSSTTTHVAAPPRGVTERILLKRMLEARPLDLTGGTPSPAPMTMRPTAVRQAPGRGETLTTARAIDAGRGRVTRPSRLHRTRTVETQLLTTSRTRQETSRVAHTTQVRETRWRQGIDVVSLEWRKAPQPPTHEATSAAVTGRSAPTPAQTRRSGEAAASAPAPDTHMPRRESTAPALTIDRSTLDRLADNVMHRIERQVRIERERRGL